MDRRFWRHMCVVVALTLLIAAATASLASAAEMGAQTAGGTVVGTYGIERAYETRTGDQQQPRIYGNWVAFVDTSAGDGGDIKLYNRTQPVNTAVKINGGSAATQTNPRIYGNRVAWMDLRNGNWDIYWYDIAKKQEHRLTSSTASEGWFDLVGDNLVYEYRVGSESDIRIYNFKTGMTTKVTDDAVDQQYPRMSGNGLVWMDMRYGATWEIVYYDLKSKTTVRVTNNATNDTMPVISGNHVAWMNYDGAQYDVVHRAYVGTDGMTATWTVGWSGNQLYPAFSGECLLFTTNHTGNYDVWFSLYPFSWWGPVSTDPGNQSDPQMWGSNIVYADDRSGNSDVYAAETLKPSLSVSVPSSVAYGAQTKVTGTLKRADGTPLAGRSIVVWYMPQELQKTYQWSWPTSKTVTTNSSGGFTAYLPATPSRFVVDVEFPGDTSDAWYAISSIRTVLPKVGLSKPSGPKSIGHSKYFTTTGRLDPAETGSGKVYIKAYRYSSGKYRLKKTLSTTLSAYDADTTKYAKKFRFGTAGKWRIRAYYPATYWNAASYSSYRYITAK